MYRRVSFFIYLFSIAVLPFAAQTAKGFIQEAIRLDDSEKVLVYLTAAVQKLPAAAEKKQVLVFLANLQEQIGAYEDASNSYYTAASIVKPSIDEMLLLDAARCALSFGDDIKAEKYIEPVLCASTDTELLARARLYSCWVQLCRALSDTVSPAPTIELLKTYAAKPNSVTPLVLLTLWWVADVQTSADAANQLKKKYPNTPEAAIVRNEVSIYPVPFWYFVPRLTTAKGDSGITVTPVTITAAPATAAITVPKSTAFSETAKSAAVSGEKIIWQQIGFFKESSNADRLIAELHEKGFKAEILKQSRQSGTVYFAVVVKENAAGTMGAELKNAGFECYPVFE